MPNDTTKNDRPVGPGRPTKPDTAALDFCINSSTSRQDGKLIFDPDWPTWIKIEFCRWVLKDEEQRLAAARGVIDD